MPDLRRRPKAWRSTRSRSTRRGRQQEEDDVIQVKFEKARQRVYDLGVRVVLLVNRITSSGSAESHFSCVARSDQTIHQTPGTAPSDSGVWLEAIVIAAILNYKGVKA